jgi:hypothetical protein
MGKVKDIQTELEFICVDSLIRKKSYHNTLDDMMTQAANISGADDKNVFLDMATSIYNSMCYTWGHPEEDDR